MQTLTFSNQVITKKSSRSFRSVSVGILILLAYSMLIFDVSGNVPFGAAADIISGLAVIGIAALMFPLFSRDRNGTTSRLNGNKFLNGAYLICKIVEGLLMIAGGLFLLTTATREYRGLIYDNIHIYFFIAGALLFYFLLYQSKLVPRGLSLWGLIASVALLAVTIVRLIGFDHEILNVILLPIVGNEFALAIWLMVKGLTNQSGTLNDTGKRISS